MAGRVSASLHSNFVDWRAQSKSFARLAAWSSRSFNYSGNTASGGTPERLRGLAEREGFLEILDGTPAIGRGFSAGATSTPGKNAVVILNHGFWLRAFGGRDGAVNETIVLNGEPYTIVGVMHPNWRFGGRDISVFTPRTFPEATCSRGAATS